MVTLILDRQHPGMRAWALQRVTAMVMTLYALAMLALLLIQQPGDYEGWKALMAPHWVRVLTLLFLLSLYLHAWLGISNILGDYVKPPRLRQFLGTATLACLGFYTAWSVRILWGL